jgi:hypothetical protein
MRAISVTILAAGLLVEASAAAQPDPDPGATRETPAATTEPAPPVAPAPAPEPAPPPPEPSPELSPAAAQLTGTPNPSALGESTGDELRFSTHGYFRAPLRVGMGDRPSCADGAVAGTVQGGVPCAGPGQSGLNFHSPYLPDDQYLDWRYTRQWERDWAEVFLNYGNSRVVGTVGLQAYNFTDASYNNTSAQFGIAQAYVTLRPNVGPSARVDWKIGSFWNKYGGAGKYDAGKYDTYMFGRTHAMGETLAGELDVGDFTIRAAHGIGAKAEQGNTAPPGFTLLHHVHAGASYKKIVDVNLHYLVSWSQDARATPAVPDGSISVVGGEARITGGIAGELYAGYSHIAAKSAQAVGPGIEVVHSLGGGGVGAGNGIVDNYLGACATCTAADLGTGSIDTLALQYDYSFGRLYRKLTTGAGFWGDGADVTLSLFGMYTIVSSRDADADGTKKLKYGADLVYSALPWLAVGARFDRVMPSSKDSEQAFTVISPKVMFRAKWITHEEITLQYSHYAFGSNVKPQAPNTAAPPDANVVGIKATMWW